jgi:hypothetical protein
MQAMQALMAHACQRGACLYLGGSCALRPLPSPPSPSRDVNRVHEEWFSDVEAVRKAVGLLEEPAPDTAEATSKVRRTV